jgi:hypothetical protein
MGKKHIVELTIINKTRFPFEYVNDWFDMGRVANGNSWPHRIEAGSSVRITCFEKDWSSAGCSGWVAYSINKVSFYFCFSNPPVRSNCIDIGTDPKTWDQMIPHYGNNDERVFKLDNNLTITVSIKNCGGDINKATWIVRDSVV